MGMKKWNVQKLWKTQHVICCGKERNSLLCTLLCALVKEECGSDAMTVET